LYKNLKKLDYYNNIWYKKVLNIEFLFI